MPGTHQWLMQAQSQASCHYLITKRGEIYQLVDLKDRAWTAGRINQPNARGRKWLNRYPGAKIDEFMVQIEYECLLYETYTDAQYRATVWLFNNLLDFKVTADNLITHKDTAIDKPDLDRERLEILRRLDADTGKLITILKLRIKILQLQLKLKELLSTGG